jgi:putative hydrolases of HD superfamily
MDEILAFQQLILKLKDIKRTGWIRVGIKNSESVADHCFSVSALAMQMADKMKLNTEKCTRLALLHELAEIKIGDLTPYDAKYKEKAEMEKKAILKIIKETGTDFFKRHIDELDENKTKEAKLVHDMDKIEMCIQALDYEKKTGKNLQEFYDYTKGKLQLKESKSLFEEIIKRRK